MINYDKLMQEELKMIGNKKNLLLHSCCGPCSTAVITRLMDYFKITVFYYNPNIEPIEEYLKRKAEQKKLLEFFPEVSLVDYDYDHDFYIKNVQSIEWEGESGPRCIACIKLRLEKTAQVASNNNFSYFTTTLTVSPHKNAQVINQFGFHLQNKYQLKFLPADFKKREGFKESIKLSQKYNLYRQDYCGCLLSKKNTD